MHDYLNLHLLGAFHLTQPHSNARKHKHGRSLSVMPWTTMDKFLSHSHAIRNELRSSDWEGSFCRYHRCLDERNGKSACLIPDSRLGSSKCSNLRPTAYLSFALSEYIMTNCLYVHIRCHEMLSNVVGFFHVTFWSWLSHRTTTPDAWSIGAMPLWCTLNLSYCWLSW